MTDQEEQLHQEQPQSGQMWQESLLEVEEGGLGVTILASVDGPIETLVQLTAKFVERGWTLAGLGRSLEKAHGVDS